MVVTLGGGRGEAREISANLKRIVGLVHIYRFAYPTEGVVQEDTYDIRMHLKEILKVELYTDSLK
jgi:hypothetical protein